ncbi:MAG: hypothetical protein A2Y07_07750 [Planctomycetes bacterium GWF2_50_10]|nr:MAG: hypothetical protein A2Y07_07750 [Planctomycetes bacterium GWF2_50_10]
MKEAEIAAVLKAREINNGIFSSSNKPIPWNTFKAEFIAAKRRRNVEESSIKEVENTLTLFESIVGKPDNQQLCQKLIDKFIDVRMKHEKKVDDGSEDGKMVQISPATVNKDLRNIKSLILWGKECEMFKARFRIHPLKTTAKPVRRLTDKEVKALITGTTDPELRLGIIIAVYTGLRRGDVWALKREQVDFKNNCLHDVVEKKCRKVTDKIFMSPACSREIKRYMDAHFGQPSDKLLKGGFPNKKWEDAKEIVSCKFHDLRRTCGSTLAGQSSSGWVPTQQLKDY